MAAPGSVSMVIPAYNHEHFVRECLESVLEQDRAPQEVIVLDDGSRDGTLGELKRFGGSIRLVASKHRGLRPTVRHGLDLATGDYVWILASDDRLEPGGIRALAELLDLHADVGLAYGHVQSIDGEGRLLGVRPRPVGIQTDARPLILINYIPATGVLARRSALTGVRQPAETLCGDWEWWLTIMMAGWAVAGSPEVVAAYRRHAASLSQAPDRIPQDLAEAHMLETLSHELAPADPPVVRSFRRSLNVRYTRLGWRYLQVLEWEAAQAAFARARWGMRPPISALAGRTFARVPALYRAWRRVRATDA